MLAAARAALGPAEIPAEGIGADAAVRQFTELLTCYGLDLSNPRAAAHLQPPPLAVAAAGDAVVGALNPSLDTYDSGPSAIAVERWVVEALARLAGLPGDADGVFTPGGSLSNLMGLLLARDRAGARRGVDVRQDGLAALGQPVVLTGELAHFSVRRACAALGLGERCVRPVALDARRRMRPDALAAALADLNRNETPIAVVATAGGTDFGAIDPLPEIASLTEAFSIWLHVDAAYGFGVLFSPRLTATLEGLDGLGRADSLALDLHKLGWQPAPASVLLTADPAPFATLEREVSYLNPADDTAAGFTGLLGRSLQTTRRADAVKVATTLLAVGGRELGHMVEHCHRLAQYAQTRIQARPALRLIGPAELTTVVFRYQPTGTDQADVDALNARLRRRLLRSGSALIGRTEVTEADGRSSVCLKLTFVNPTATESDVDQLLDAVCAAAVQECA
ncbi:MAG: aspartate aminotransferase family protein [Pseudonocardia sp.]|nr:aspartate aminotransferase family protein [Pseudonocardia sp.]